MTDAVNLDGGGSTTMVVDGQIVNSPSDAAGERPVGDAVLVLPR
jgi:exopolysaccharide biosynthesis protein